MGLASAVNTMVPGPCLILTFGKSMSSGIRPGLGVLVGIIFAKLLLVLLTLMLIFGSLSVSDQAFEVLRWLGIVALCFLAMRMVRSSGSRVDHQVPSETPRVGNVASGVLVGLSSPYNLIFFLGILPQFVNPERFDSLHSVYAIVAVLSGAAIILLGATILGQVAGRAFCNASGLVTHIDRVGAAFLVGFAVIATVTPMH